MEAFVLRLQRSLLTYLGLAVALVLGLTAPLHAQAQEQAPTETMDQATTTDADMTDLQARGKFRLGKELYDQGRFAEAAKEFEIAYGLSGRGQLLYNVYLAYRDAQDTENAARALRGYLAAVSDAPDREHLTARLKALDAQLKQAEEDAARQKAEADAAQAQAREADRQRMQADQRAQAAERRADQKPSRPWWPWLLVGGGIAASGTGVVLGIMANGDADDLKAECVLDPRDGAGTAAPLMMGDRCAPSVDLDGRRDSIQTQALIGDVLWISGAVIATTGLVLAFALPDVYPDLEEAPVTAGCSTRECSATLRLRF
jgi:tetratricopeptide (TPR) repeat protein